MAAEHVGGFGVGAGVGAEAPSGEDEFAAGQVGEVAFAFVDVLGFGEGPAGGAVPLLVGVGLGAAFGVAEAGAVGDAVDDEGAVGGVDHVGEAGLGFEAEDLVAESGVDVGELFPLGAGEGGVDGGGGVHPGVDGVLDRVVGGAAHEVRAAAGRPGRGHLVR
nr:hypothetical protein GCM10025732_09700 [Glycomyces mayteni]